MCCTVRGDLIETLGDLARRRESGEIVQFQRAVIETTGLADPAPIIHTIMNDPGLTALYELDGVLTVVDAVNGDATLDNHAEAVKQVAVADRLVLTKLDCLPSAAGDRTARSLRGRLNALNPGAQIVETAPDFDSSALLNVGVYDPRSKSPDVAAWLNDEAYADSGHERHVHPERHHDVNRHDDRVRSFCLVEDKPLSLAGFTLFLEVLAMRHGADLLRMKGIVSLEEHPGTPAIVHGVQHVFHPAKWLPAWPDDDTRTRLVFITRDIARETIENLFRALCGDASASGKLVEGIQHRLPIRSRIPVARQEEPRRRCPKGSDLASSRGFDAPRGRDTRPRGRLPELIGRVARSFRCISLRFVRLTGELGKPSYGYRMLDFFH